MENILEDKHMKVDEGLEENDEIVSSNSQDVPFLAGLNLFWLVSYLALSEDECLSLEDTEKMEIASSQEPKESILRVRAEKRKLHEPKLVESRVQSKVRDCRSPATFRIHSKMLSATSKVRFRREMDGVHYEIQANDPTEMNLEVLRFELTEVFQ